jgi:hypothetical protein
MQTFPLASVPLLVAGLWILAGQNASAQAAPPKFAKPPRLHAVVLGAVRSVPFAPADATADEKKEDTLILKVRPLIVDEREREWTTGNLHEVTERSFVVRRVMRLNDALAEDHGPHWTWVPGSWLLVDRVTGHITALHLPNFDSAISDVVWYRDYAAYCGIGSGAHDGLFAVVAEIGARRAVATRRVGDWPQSNHFIPVCQPAHWERTPIRVTLQPTGGTAVTFNVVGSSSLVEEGDSDEP